MGFLFDSLVFDVLFILCSLVGYMIYRIRKHFRFFADRGVPYLPPNLFTELKGIFVQMNIQDRFDEMYKHFQGQKYGGFYNLGAPGIYLKDPDLIMKILTNDFAFFNDHGIPADPEGYFLDDNLFTMYGPRWKAMRKKLAPTFTSGKLKGMVPLIQDCIKNLLIYLDEKLTTDFELKDTFSRFALDVIGSVAFGVDSRSLQDEESDFKRMSKEVVFATMRERIRSVIKIFKNKTLNRITLTTKEIQVAEFFRNLLTQSFEHRKRTGRTRNDFVDLLLQLKEKGSVEIEAADKDEAESESAIASIENVKLDINDDLLTAQSFIFYFAGHETTATCLTFLIYLFAKYPEVQSKARAEVKSLQEKQECISYDSAKTLEYLNACILECLRIFPPIIALPRVCSKDYRMEDGFVIRKGTFVLVPITSLHHDPEYFPDPESFIPERFLRGDHIRPGTFIPFGEGPRVCVGKRFALLEMQLAAASILDRYEILTNPKMIEPLEILSNLVIPAPKGGTWVTLKKLTD